MEGGYAPWGAHTQSSRLQAQRYKIAGDIPTIDTKIIRPFKVGKKFQNTAKIF